MTDEKTEEQEQQEYDEFIASISDKQLREAAVDHANTLRVCCDVIKQLGERLAILERFVLKVMTEAMEEAEPDKTKAPGQYL